MSVTPLEALPLERLRERSSSKWRTYPADVLPLFVAETDFPLAPAITRELAALIERGDTGYTPPDPGLARAYAAFAERRFGWILDPARVRSTCDVMMGVVEILRGTIAPGDRVVVTPPVYPPFYDCVPEAGGVVERVPLRDTGEAWELDLDRIAGALASGARAVLECWKLFLVRFVWRVLSAVQHSLVRPSDSPAAIPIELYIPQVSCHIATADNASTSSAFCRLPDR